MKTLMPVRIVLLSVAIIALSTVSFAQNRERFGISAKAGGVNAAVGRVTVNRADQLPQLLSSTDDLVAGDIVTTGAAASVEVLLNPGSYLRLSENSEFQFQDTALDNLRLKLTKGVAILEITGAEGLKFEIPVETQRATFTILRSGLYRINVQSDMVELAVRKGRATSSIAPEVLVKGGKKITIGNGTPIVGKIDKNQDGFDLWSKQRAELLARANERLSNRVLNGYLATFQDARLGGSRWGLWTFSSRMGCYTFLPFYWGWSSPYGHNYGSYFDVDYWRGGGWGNRNTSPGTSGGTIVNNQPPSGTNGGGSPGGSPAPSYSPPPVSSPPIRVDPDTGQRTVNKSRDP